MQALPPQSSVAAPPDGKIPAPTIDLGDADQVCLLARNAALVATLIVLTVLVTYAGSAASPTVAGDSIAYNRPPLWMRPAM